MHDIILFDLDGTLTFSEEGITNCVKYALESFALHETDRKKLLLFIGPPLKDCFMELYGFDEEKADAAVEKYRERYSAKGYLENELVAGTDDLLKKLKNDGYTIVLATSKPINFSLKILEFFDILKYFDECVGAELHGGINEKKDIIAEVIRRLGEDKKPRMIMVGDRKMDILGAKENGIKSIGVRYGYAPDGELEAAGADYIADTTEDIGKIVYGLKER